MIATAGTAVELAMRLLDRRWAWRGGDCDIERIAEFVEHATPTEAGRLANRLRRQWHRENLRDGGCCPPDEVPTETLGEIWDGRVRVWSHNGGPHHHVSAVTVVRGTYLDTFGGPPSGEVCRDQFGTQVVARSSSAGRADAFAVFWRNDGPEGSGAWRRVTEELSAEQMSTWHGIPARFDRQGATDRGMTEWLNDIAGTENR